jgi:hypothetical protein
MRIAISPGIAVVLRTWGGETPAPRLFTGYRQDFLRRAREDRCELLTLQAGASHQTATNLRKRKDRVPVGGLYRATIEDANFLALGTQMFDETSADVGVHLNSFL